MAKWDFFLDSLSDSAFFPHQRLQMNSFRLLFFSPAVSARIKSRFLSLALLSHSEAKTLWLSRYFVTKPVSMTWIYPQFGYFEEVRMVRTFSQRLRKTREEQKGPKKVITSSLSHSGWSWSRNSML